ncbi:SulP family inorganic anion transporter [Ectothiorhodospira variabilis]|uniref:SulP family inorganic anion transporter n=1 Tax=Ectothiorhodospira variabilis TaxID=505694 RepID=UPI001EFAED76|nr:SulP family inorganic anion transporter [Ectothiorhodospira variabilis]MCG5497773.1 STAS domain-containing protein [Ectothiorhodospira variabilis]
MNSIHYQLFPFLRWQKPSREILKSDLAAGTAVALVLVPQSMAYAQLAGMPPVYGLYASLLPVIVAALWGSSNQLATGPVAVVSLLTATALIPLAAPGSGEYVALAVALAFLVGVVQLSMGVLRMGALVSFISHPVIVGFTNAAALVIGLSQLNKLLGIPVDTGGHFLMGLWDMLGDVAYLHWPTLAFGVGAILIMVGLKRFIPRVPGVLAAVILATAISWLMGFERKADVHLDQVSPPAVAEQLLKWGDFKEEKADLELQIREQQALLEAADSTEAAALRYKIELLSLRQEHVSRVLKLYREEMRDVRFARLPGEEGQPDAFVVAQALDERGEEVHPKWRVTQVDGVQIRMDAGGRVIGSIPAGLPSISMPDLTPATLTALFTAAFVIALVGFTEAIAISRALAARTGQRLNPNQELIGQGLGNLSASVSQGYPVSGSFSRSAVNLNAGARTGLSSVFTAVFILLVLLFFTPLFYHLPEAVLAAIIVMAVVGLINFKAIQHAWLASRHDGIAAIVTFVATLAVAPNLDVGILIGVALAVGLFLYRTMRPRVSELTRYEDGTLREARRYGLRADEEIGLLRFDRSLYFANAGYFEDAVLEQAARYPHARYMIVVTQGVNEIDASGEEVIRSLVQRLRARGTTLVFAGIKPQVLMVMKRTHLVDFMGEDNVFHSTEGAIATIRDRLAKQKAEEGQADQEEGENERA